jgi:signal transduction histidine kinase
MERFVRALSIATAFLLCFVFLGGPVDAEDRGTEAEAKALVAKAIAAYDAKGKSVFAEMTAPNTAFTHLDLYMFVIGPDHSTVAHGADASQVGRDVLALKDANGKLFGRELFDKATQNGTWVDYVYKDPTTGKEEPKSSWVVRHDNYVFGCGVYRPKT